MDSYIGTKNVLGKPMSKADFDYYMGRPEWSEENQKTSDLGYLVEYLDGGKPNHPKHDGYISWSPIASSEDLRAKDWVLVK